MRIRLFSFVVLSLLTVGVHTRAHAHDESVVAVASLEARIAASPAQAELYLQRALNREARGEIENATSDLLLAEKLSPESPAVSLAVARLALSSGQLDSAHRQLDALIHSTPANAEAFVLRAQLHRQLADDLAAHSDYSRALDVLEVPTPDLYLARAALKLPNALALAGIEEGLARLGPAMTLLERGCELAQLLGRTDAALNYLDQIDAHTDRHELTLHRRGIILAAAGRIGEARAVFTQALAHLAAQPNWLRASPEGRTLAASLLHSIATLKPLP